MDGQSVTIMGPAHRYPQLVIRPALLGDDPRPSFSNCTLPFVFVKGHESNFGHLLVSLLPNFYSFWAQGATNRQVTYVMGTLHGLPVPLFVKDILRPFTQYEVQTLADFSSRLPADFPSKATAEGRHVRCFEKLIACKIIDAIEIGVKLRDMEIAPEFFYKWYKKRKLLPSNPAGFEPRSSDKLGVVNRRGPIRILIADRKNSTRMILNVDELVSECNNDPGPWDCRAFAFGSGLLRDMEAVRSAEVLVAVHGAGAANFIMMRKGTALLEIAPYEFHRGTNGRWDFGFQSYNRQGDELPGSLLWAHYRGPLSQCSLHIGAAGMAILA
eukprot:jgi/Botrbrau1/2459/Bobra.0226s0018.1